MMHLKLRIASIFPTSFNKALINCLTEIGYAGLNRPTPNFPHQTVDTPCLSCHTNLFPFPLMGKGVDYCLVAQW